MIIVQLTSPEPPKTGHNLFFTFNIENANTIGILATFLLRRYSSLNVKPYQSCTLHSLWSVVSTYFLYGTYS